MIYKEYKSSKELSTLVKCYWTLENSKKKAFDRQTIIPDGCMEMIFHLGDLYRQYKENGISIIQPRCFIIGQLTRPLEIEPTGETRIFSVRFHTNGFVPFSNIRLKEIENTAVPLEKLFGEEGKRIEQMILNSNSTSKRIEIIEKYLVSRLTGYKNVEHIIKSTVEMICTVNGQLSVNELSKQANVNRRQLERKFSSVVGLSPKQLCKTIRLQATFKMLLNNRFTSLTALAHDNEFYDQAHFIKDFKELTGFTPKEFYKDNLKMSSLFYEED